MLDRRSLRKRRFYSTRKALSQNFAAVQDDARTWSLQVGSCLLREHGVLPYGVCINSFM